MEAVVKPPGLAPSRASRVGLYVLLALAIAAVLWEGHYHYLMSCKP
jgi:hypothetical protein